MPDARGKWQYFALMENYCPHHGSQSGFTRKNMLYTQYFGLACDVLVYQACSSKNLFSSRQACPSSRGWIECSHAGTSFADADGYGDARLSRRASPQTKLVKSRSIKSPGQPA